MMRNQRMSRGYRSYGSYEVPQLERWKKEASAALRVAYPTPPAALKISSYVSVFHPMCSATWSATSIHLADYQNLVTCIATSGNYRVAARLNAQRLFPVPEPSPISFPICPTEPESRTAPPSPGWLTRLLDGKEAERLDQLAKDVRVFNEWLSSQSESVRSEWEAKKREFDERCDAISRQWQHARSEWQAHHREDTQRGDALIEGYRSPDNQRIADYFRVHLSVVPLPLWCPRSIEVVADCGSGMLLLDLQLPFFRDLAVWKTRSLKGGDKSVPATKSESTHVKKNLSFLIPLRLLWEAAQMDIEQRITTVACNAHVIYNDPATGRVRQDTILSVVADAARMRGIELHRVEPEACFRGLRGVAAADILELVPVQPLLDFDKNDSRFVEAKAVLDPSAAMNLATMDWQDFEHLVRELFEKEFGADVRITQASRDRGVDAVAFDPDPIRGGKFVIQAKRYVHTVDVSAVRDLYGTMMNEGANRGILVTTSNYGRDAFEFAQGKPITLLSGANLLHLLVKHGYHFYRIDLDGMAT